MSEVVDILAPEACEGLFEALTNHERVAILLDLLGRKVRVVLDAGAVEAA